MVIAIEEVKSSHHVVLNPDVTYTYPVNSCASGKVLLSWLSDEALNTYLDSIVFRQKTEHTIVDKQTFIQAVRQAGVNGFAVELLEFGNHLNSVSAPVYNRSGEIIATVSISGPSMRLTEERMRELVEPLKQAARQITDKMINNTKTGSL
jgi:DNA-binding IclR family transcriptional regulator